MRKILGCTFPILVMDDFNELILNIQQRDQQRLHQPKGNSLFALPNFHIEVRESTKAVYYVSKAVKLDMKPLGNFKKST